MNQLGQVGVADERLVYVGAHQLDLLVVRPIDLLQKSNENQDSTTNSDNGYLLMRWHHTLDRVNFLSFD